MYFYVFRNCISLFITRRFISVFVSSQQNTALPYFCFCKIYFWTFTSMFPIFTASQQQCKKFLQNYFNKNFRPFLTIHNSDLMSNSRNTKLNLQTILTNYFWSILYLFPPPFFLPKLKPANRATLSFVWMKTKDKKMGD